MTLIALNKPFGTMSQFSEHPSRQTLAEWIATPGVYPAGRLDADSEGLLLLTDDGGLQARIADPRHKLAKTYFAQVEGIPDEAALARLRQASTSATSIPCPRKYAPWKNRRGSGRGIRRYATARRSRQAGWNCRSAKARTGRSAA